MTTSLWLLASDDFLRGLTYPPAAMKHLYDRDPTVAKVTDDIKNGKIVDGHITSFVKTLLKDFKKGYNFRYDRSLAALAVACGRIDTEFTDAFLAELVMIRISEMPIGPRVAKLVIDDRKTTHTTSAPS